MAVSAQAAAGGEAGLAAWIPLFQTALWVVAIIVVLIVFRRQISLLREAINKRLADGGSFKMGPFEFGELKERVNAVENKVDDLTERVSRAFLVAMSDAMYLNLEKLSTGRFGPYEKTPGLIRELRYLRDLGYVQIESVTKLHDRGDDLSKHARITPRGSAFVSLRREIDGRMESGVMPIRDSTS
jgi:hypothetical protein